MYVEKDEESGFVDAYGITQFPTIVWTDAQGEAVATTIHPECPEDALKELDFARRWLRGEVDLGD